MENNNLTPTAIPAQPDKEQELTVLFAAMRKFARLIETQGEQMHLTGKPNTQQQDLDYLLAISG